MVHCTLCFTFYTHRLCQKLTNKVLWLKCFEWRCRFTSVIRIVFRLITTTVQEPPLKFHRFVCLINFSGILLLLQFLKSQLSNVRLIFISMLISHYIFELGSAKKLYYTFHPSMVTILYGYLPVEYTFQTSLDTCYRLPFVFLVR